MTRKMNYILAGLFYALFVVLIVLLLNVDVTPSGVRGTDIGLSGINVTLRDSIGISKLFYNISKVCGIIGIAAALGYVLQLALRALKKKTPGILSKTEWGIAILYFVTAILYVAFDKFVVNYRPFIKWDETAPESSFPSTHSLIAVVIFGSLYYMAEDYIKQELTLKITQMSCVILGILVIIGRLFSGVHWFTDVLGGIFLGLALLLTFTGSVMQYRPVRQRVYDEDIGNEDADDADADDEDAADETAEG